MKNMFNNNAINILTHACAPRRKDYSAIIVSYEELPDMENMTQAGKISFHLTVTKIQVNVPPRISFTIGINQGTRLDLGKTKTNNGR